MKIIKTKFKDLLIIKRPTHYDNRGFLKELFEQKKHKKNFIFDYFSLSKKNVIRGLHIQLKKPHIKLISVINGKIFDHYMTHNLYNFSDSTLAYFINHYMEPVVAETHGYRLKDQFKHLLPPVYGRPTNYYLTPYLFC